MKDRLEQIPTGVLILIGACGLSLIIVQLFKLLAFVVLVLVVLWLLDATQDHDPQEPQETQL